MAHRFHVADVQLRPEAPACRTADAQVLPRYPAAESVLLHHARDLAPHLVVALAGDHVAGCCGGAPSKADRGVALAAPAGPGSGDCAPCLPRPPPRSNGEGERPSRGPDGGAVTPGRARPPGLPPSNGEGDTRPAPSSGFAVAPGRGRAPGLPFPRSTGNGEPPNEGACVAPGATRPALPRGPGEPPDRDLRPLDLSLGPAPGCPPRARQHALAAEHSLDFRL